MVRLRALRRADALLREAGIAALFVKGPVLAVLLGEDPLVRDSEDLDLLVARGEASEALAALAAGGFRTVVPVAPSARAAYLRTIGQIPLAGPGRILLDLHLDLAPAHFPGAWTLPRLLPASRTVAVDGVPVRTLSAEDTLLHLCHQGAVDLWSRPRAAAAVARLLEVDGPRDDVRLVAGARRRGALRMLAVGLAVAAARCGAAIPPPLAALLPADPAAARMASLFAARLADPSAPPIPPAVAVRLHAALHGRLRDRFLLAARLLHLPRTEEWATGPAPAPLRWIRRGVRGLRRRGERLP